MQRTLNINYYFFYSCFCIDNWILWQIQDIFIGVSKDFGVAQKSYFFAYKVQEFCNAYNTTEHNSFICNCSWYGIDQAILSESDIFD